MRGEWYGWNSMTDRVDGATNTLKAGALAVHSSQHPFFSLSDGAGIRLPACFDASGQQSMAMRARLQHRMAPMTADAAGTVTCHANSRAINEQIVRRRAHLSKTPDINGEG